ncbi:MAG TPA: sensor histidine kinase [Candidatus Dormibacteraeota bacterium]|nr:sensor histidine kinase [Candidatus Dormibacteraeota bacterium]
MTFRHGRVLSSAFALSWLGILALYVQDLVNPHGQIQHRDVFVPMLLAFVAIYVTFWVWGIYHSLPTRVVLVAAMVAVNTGLVVVGGNAAGSIFIYTVVVAGAAFGWRTGVVVVTLISVEVLFGDYSGVHDWVKAGSVALQELLIGLGTVAVSLLIRTVVALREARDELARLAVGEERLRFARDLHDLLGHSLSVVVLKSELAQQMLKKDPGRAAVEISEIERVAREALRDVREAVAGYRKTNLATELSGAREMLESAGISCRLQEEAGDLPGDSETALAWAVREGATNVLRHSQARECQVRLTRENGHATLEILDDGRGAGSAPAGNGLRGLGERVRAVGGEVKTGPAEGHGFRLLVTVPAL